MVKMVLSILFNNFKKIYKLSSNLFISKLRLRAGKQVNIELFLVFIAIQNKYYHPRYHHRAIQPK